MKIFSTPWLAACSALLGAILACAAVADSRFEISSDGVNVEFEVRDVPRRDVLNLFFASTGIELKWLNAAFADEPISGKFQGTLASVARQLLSRTNFVIAYDDASRLARVIVVGPAAKEQAGAGLAAIAAAMPTTGRKPKRPVQANAKAPTEAVAENQAAASSSQDSRPAPAAPAPGSSPIPTLRKDGAAVMPMGTPTDAVAIATPMHSDAAPVPLPGGGTAAATLPVPAAIAGSAAPLAAPRAPAGNNPGALPLRQRGQVERDPNGRAHAQP